MEVFLALGVWYPSLRAAMEACRRAQAEAAAAEAAAAEAAAEPAEAAAAEGGAPLDPSVLTAKARDQSAEFAAEVRAQLKKVEGDAYINLRQEGNWKAFEEMCRISRERIDSNRFKALRAAGSCAEQEISSPSPEISRPAPEISFPAPESCSSAQGTTDVARHAP